MPFEKGHSYGFKGNPQNINRKGRPKKSWGSINEVLQQRGITKLTKQELIDAYSLIFNCDQVELEELLLDEGTPVAMKAMISSMRDPKFRDQALRDYRDYMFGRSASQVEVTFKEQPLFPQMTHHKELSSGDPGLQIPETIEVEAELIEESSPQDEEKKK